MWPPTIVVSDEFINCSLQMVVTKYEPVIETFVPDGAYPAPCECIGLGRFHWSADLSDGKLTSAVVNNKKHVQCLKPNGLHSEEITCSDLSIMLSQELSPTGRGRSIVWTPQPLSYSGISVGR